MNNTIIRIGITLVSFLISAYALYGIDYAKMLRKGYEDRALMLYFLLSMGLGYVVAQFLLSLSSSYLF